MKYQNIEIVDAESGLIDVTLILNKILQYPYAQKLLWEKTQTLKIFKNWKTETFLNTKQQKLLDKLILFFEEEIVEIKYNALLTMGEFIYENHQKYKITSRHTFLALWNYTHTTSQEIIMTDDIIELFYEINYLNLGPTLNNLNEKKKLLIEFMNNFGLKYKLIDHNSENITDFPYIMHIMENTSAELVSLKNWIILTKDNFLELAIYKSKDYNQYYTKLSEIFNDYKKYVSEYA